jgi:hypothetical protein
MSKEKKEKKREKKEEIKAGKGQLDARFFRQA